jgi:hypothetical protein
MCSLKRYYYLQQRHGHVLKETAKVTAETKCLKGLVGKTRTHN